MDVAKAAEHTLTLLRKNMTDPLPGPAQAEDGQGLKHQLFVLYSVKDGEVVGEKAHRWLGWAQGALSAMDLLSLEECKYANLLA